MKLLLVGAGGHARTVFDLAQRCDHRVTAYVDRARVHQPWLGEATQLDVSDERALGDPRLAGLADAAVMGLGGTRPEQLAVRFGLFERYAAAFANNPPALIHPAAAVADGDAVAAGALVMAAAVVNAGARVGRAAIVNSGAIIEHDAVVDAGAHVAPGAIVLGGAHVGTNAMIGAGAVVLPGARVPAGGLVPALTRFAGEDQ